MKSLLKFINRFNMNRITIDGVTTEVSGNNIRVQNGSIYVDGNLVASGKSNDVHIKFEGDLANLDATSVNVTGNVTGNIDATSVKIGGDVGGNVDGTSIDIKGSVKGKVDGTTVKIGSR